MLITGILCFMSSIVAPELRIFATQLFSLAFSSRMQVILESPEVTQ